MDGRVSLRALQQTKEDGRKIAGVVARVYQIARILDRAGVDLVSVGDTVGVNLWGQANPSRYDGPDGDRGPGRTPRGPRVRWSASGRVPRAV